MDITRITRTVYYAFKMSLDKNEVYEVPIYKREYQIGTCFICQKCLYYGINLTIEECQCNKNEKPTGHNRTAKVRNYRCLYYNASSCQPYLKELMKTSNLKFGYEIDLELSSSCSLCSACNSKILRENAKAEKKIKNVKGLDIEKSNKSTLKSSTGLVVDLPKELQLRISIKNGKETLPSILVNWALDNMEYIDFLSKVELLVSEHVGLVFKGEYFLAYKSTSESGAGTLLNNENSFEEFLKDYQQYTSSKKKVVVIVIIKDQEKKKKKREYKVDDNSGTNTDRETDEEVRSKSKKKITVENRVPKESKLDEKEKLLGEIMIQLKDKYVCNVNSHKHCFVKGERHLPLSNLSFSMWAQDIFKSNTDFETPPNHAIFSMLHSVKISNTSLVELTADIPIPLSSYYAKAASSNMQNLLPNIIHNNVIEIPSMNEFLKELDQKYGVNKFTCYLQKFEEEEILVNQLSKLSDAEYNLMGILKIGRRQILRDESKKYN